MLVVIDTHVHVYPSFDLKTFLQNAFRSLSSFGPGDQQGEATAVRKVLSLTERSDCHFFRSLAEGAVTLPDEFSLVRFSADEHALGVRNGAGELIYILAGRQIVTEERVEVLALTADLSISDGLPLVDVVRRVCQGAVCVLSWSPGKWYFHRGAIIRNLLKEMDPSRVLLGDTTLRPTLYPEPTIMRRARMVGFRVVAGSDPLPFPGEERWVGDYVTIIKNAAFDDRRPAQSLRKIFYDEQSEFLLCGKRNSIFNVGRRIVKNQRVRLS